MPSYSLDKELKEVADSLISKHYSLLKELKIEFLFRDEVAISQERVTAGMCVKVNDRDRTLHGADIIIEIARPIWTEATANFKKALMDHELSHIGVKVDGQGKLEVNEATGRPKLFIRRHDIEEFADVLERNQGWHKDLRDFLARWEQTHTKKPAKPE